MFAVEVYATVRQLVFNEGKSRREVARLLGLSQDTVCKMCRFSAPPSYVRSKPVARPKLGPLIGVIDAILEHDRTAPPKQRHTAKRVFERLRDEHGFAGGLHNRAGLCPGGVHAAEGDLRAAVPPAGPCSGRFWRGARCDRRRAGEDPLLLHGPAALGCLLREGVPGRDAGSVSRRARLGLCLLGWGAALGAL